MTKNRTATAIALILMLSMTFSLVALPAVNALDYPVYAYIAVTPNPIGVGQTAVCTFWLDRPSPIAAGGFNPLKNWNGFMVTITKPDNTTQTMGPYTSDATGGNWFNYVPDTVGTYYFQFSFPGQTFGIDHFLAANSEKAALEVQQEPIPDIIQYPLPTNYWTRPIYGEFRGWERIGGNWLMPKYNASEGPKGGFNPYSTAPNTAHIVWAKPIAFGGVVGGEKGAINYYQAPTYQSYWAPPIIISGRLYTLQRFAPGNAWQGLRCTDIRTGKEIFFQTGQGLGGGGGGGGVSPTMQAQLLDYEGPNAHGVVAWIWNFNFPGTSYLYDAYTGVQILSVTDCPRAPTAYVTMADGSNFTNTSPSIVRMNTDKGDTLAFIIDGVNNWLACWNATKCIGNTYTPTVGAAISFKTGIEWNVTIPDRPGCPFFRGETQHLTTDVIVAYSTGYPVPSPQDNITTTAYSTKDGHELWWKTDILPKGSNMYGHYGPMADGVGTIFQRQTMEWYGYDLNTGTALWGPTKCYTNSFDQWSSSNAAYGKLFTTTYGGQAYCMDLKNGNLLWNTSFPTSGFNGPYGYMPLGNSPIIADGKLYVTTGEHTPNSPYYQDAKMWCLDAATGTMKWNISGWWSSPVAIADGYILAHNCYDGQIYSFNKGQTAVTVSAPDIAITQGQPIVIKGTVMDKSPGTMDSAGNQLNTEGSPAIADEYMTQWMEYLYQQKPMPTNATGVPVTLSVIDANNNFRNIGTTTSDITGAFSLMWKPDIPGKYTLIASFAGSESYYPSSAETAFGVTESASATTTPATLPISVADTYFVPAIAGIIVAIIIGFVVLALLMLRKKP